MVTVKGTLDGVAYDVVLTGRRHGPVEGSRRVLALVEAAARSHRLVPLGPTGPDAVVDGGNVDTVLALLAQVTTIAEIAGRSPAAARKHGALALIR